MCLPDSVTGYYAVVMHLTAQIALAYSSALCISLTMLIVVGLDNHYMLYRRNYRENTRRVAKFCNFTVTTQGTSGSEIRKYGCDSQAMKEVGTVSIRVIELH